MFFDRYDAGERLASKLQQYKNTDAVVYALPRGGVLVGYEVARALHLPLDVVITRKIGHPMNREVAICAITVDGERVCDEPGIYGIDEAWIKTESSAQRQEAERRRKAYKKDAPILPATDKIAIIVDDGVATGLTLRAAILEIIKQSPRKIVVAVPVSPYEVSEKLRAQVDEFVVLHDDKRYRGAVGAYYTHFGEVSDGEVVSCLQNVTSFQTTEHAAVIAPQQSTHARA